MSEGAVLEARGIRKSFFQGNRELSVLRKLTFNWHADNPWPFSAFLVPERAPCSISLEDWTSRMMARS